jgi:hypothetical protein
MSAKLNTLLKQVDAAANEIFGAIQGIDSQIAALQFKSHEIGQAPVRRAEFVRYVGDELDSRAGNMSTRILSVLRRMDLSFFAIEKGSIPAQFLTGGDALPVVISEMAAYWYLKPAILASIEELTESMDFPEDSQVATVEERRVMIAEIDAEIAGLRAQRETLVSQLRKFGLIG